MRGDAQSGHDERAGGEADGQTDGGASVENDLFPKRGPQGIGKTMGPATGDLRVHDIPSIPEQKPKHNRRTHKTKRPRKGSVEMEQFGRRLLAGRGTGPDRKRV